MDKDPKILFVAVAGGMDMLNLAELADLFKPTLPLPKLELPMIDIFPALAFLFTLSLTVLPPITILALDVLKLTLRLLTLFTMVELAMGATVFFPNPEIPD